MTGAIGCTTCRSIRRFLLAFALGGYLCWEWTGSLPFEGQNAEVFRILLIIVAAFYAVGIGLRVRQMRQTWRR